MKYMKYGPWVNGIKFTPPIRPPVWAFPATRRIVVIADEPQANGAAAFPESSSAEPAAGTPIKLGRKKLNKRK